MNLVLPALASALLLLPAAASAQNAYSCIHTRWLSGRLHMQNHCRDDVVVSWSTSYGNCRGTPCSVAVPAGQRVVTSTMQGDAMNRLVACHWQSWVQGSCRFN